MNWLTLYTKPRSERQAHDFLQAAGVETYFPVVAQYSTHRRAIESAPFFPCYLFVRVDPAAREFSALPWTPGLRCIVRFDGRPAWLPDRVISELRQHLGRLDRSGYFDPRSQFRPGDRVRITAGPLKDMEAVFDRAVSKEGRVRILLDFIGRFTACEVEADCLAKVG